MSDFCELHTPEFFCSTNLNSKIDSYNRLAKRILWQLGVPSINVEIARDALYENISIAADFFTTYAGQTDEYLVFSSELYKNKHGLRLDHLFSVRDSLTGNNNTSTTFNTNIETPEYVYVCNSDVASSYTTDISSLSGIYPNGIKEGEIISLSAYGILTDPTQHGVEELSANFTQSNKPNFSIKGESTDPVNQYSNAFDYDIMDYRKVNSIVGLEMGESTGINTLFTIEQTLAQQTYFSYAMGNYGFDLISWYVLKNWLDTREKLLSINPTYSFNNRTQMLTLFPEPSNSRYWAVLHCLVERPLRDILKSQWVQKYSLALTKITIANIRGKFNNLSLFGGGALNYSDLYNSGTKEKEELEKDLLEGSTPGLGDSRPPMFFIG